jgi:signal transduction histidine kinase
MNLRASLHRWTAALLPESALSEAELAELVALDRETLARRMRRWGWLVIVGHIAVMLAVDAASTASPRERLWQRTVVWLFGAMEVNFVLHYLAFARDRGVAKVVADHAAKTISLVSLCGFAGLALNAQRLHGSIGQYLALMVSLPFLYPTNTLLFTVAATASSGALVASLSLSYGVATQRANVVSLVAFTLFVCVLGRLYNESRVREMRYRSSLRTLNNELESRVLAQTQALRALTVRLDDALESERRRIASELHDDLGQELTALRLQLQALLHSAPSDAHRARLTAMGDGLDRAHVAVRAILESLRPRILDEEGLESALAWLATQFRERSGIACTVDVVLYDEPLPLVSLGAFRIAQESLTNIMRHARAKHATLTLQTEAHELCLTITDDGAHEGVVPGRGISGMRERAERVGGSVTIAANPGGGTRVTARLPLDHRATPVERLARDG